jgi:hypothetical protein
LISNQDIEAYEQARRQRVTSTSAADGRGTLAMRSARGCFYLCATK